MFGFDERDADLAERAGRAMVRVLVPTFILVAAVVCATGCAPVEAAAPVGIEGAAYRSELAECREKSATCPGYVACRQRVETAHGRTWAGRCEP